MLYLVANLPASTMRVI